MYGSKVVELNATEILERITSLDIFVYYLGKGVMSGGAFHSPLRKDSKPSFTIFKHRDGTYLYKDFSTGDVGDCFTLLSKMYGLNHGGVCKLIDNDFRLGLSTSKFTAPTKQFVGEHNENLEKDMPSSTTIQIKSRPWNSKEDKSFWGKYGITCEILKAYNVKAALAVFVNGDLAVESNKYNPIYSYDFGDGRMKIYQPYSKTYKWLSNTSSTDLQGLSQIPEKGDTLVITKSLKDVMCLAAFGIPAVAPSSESCIIPDDVVSMLYSRYARIIILYDFDRTGVSFANKHRKLYGFEYLFITNGRFGTFDYEVKDFSDFIAKFGTKKASELIEFVCQ